MRSALAIAVLGVGFLLTTQVAQPQTESKAKRSFLDLVQVGDKFTLSETDSAVRISLLTEQQVQEYAERRQEYEKRLKELEPEIEQLRKESPPSFREQRLSREEIEGRSREEIMELLKKRGEQQQKLRDLQQERSTMSNWLRSRVVHEVTEVGQDFIGFKSETRMQYVPRDRIMKVYGPVENPPQPDATE